MVDFVHRTDHLDGIDAWWWIFCKYRGGSVAVDHGYRANVSGHAGVSFAVQSILRGRGRELMFRFVYGGAT